MKSLILTACAVTIVCSMAIGVGSGLAERQGEPLELNHSKVVEPPSLASMMAQAYTRGSWSASKGLPFQNNPYAGKKVWVDGQEVGGELAAYWNKGWNENTIGSF